MTINAQNKPDMLPAKKCCFVVSSPINFKAAPKLAKLTTNSVVQIVKVVKRPRYNERGVNKLGVNFTFTGCYRIFSFSVKKKDSFENIRTDCILVLIVSKGCPTIAAVTPPSIPTSDVFQIGSFFENPILI